MERGGFVFWQKDIETMPRAEIRALQLKKLQHTVKWNPYGCNSPHDPCYFWTISGGQHQMYEHTGCDPLKNK